MFRLVLIQKNANGNYETVKTNHFYRMMNDACSERVNATVGAFRTQHVEPEELQLSESPITEDNDTPEHVFELLDRFGNHVKYFGIKHVSV